MKTLNGENIYENNDSITLNELLKENKKEKYFAFLYIYAYNKNIKAKRDKILKIKEKEGFL